MYAASQADDTGGLINRFKIEDLGRSSLAPYHFFDWHSTSALFFSSHLNRPVPQLHLGPLHYAPYSIRVQTPLLWCRHTSNCVDLPPDPVNAHPTIEHQHTPGQRNRKDHAAWWAPPVSHQPFNGSKKYKRWLKRPWFEAVQPTLICLLAVLLGNCLVYR